MSMHRLPFFHVLLFLASGLVTSAQVASYRPPALTSLGSLSSNTGVPGILLTAPATFTPGDATSLTIHASFTGQSSDPLIGPITAATGEIRVSITSASPKGAYRMESVTFGSPGRTTVYMRNGTILHINYPSEGLAATHSLNFSALDFNVVDPAALPQITAQPVNVRATVGQSAGFNIVTTSATPATIQWRKNGSAIPGATQSQLNFSAVATDDVGTYDAVITNATGSVSSTPATLTVGAGRMKNISVRIVVPASGTLTAGMVLETPKAVLVRGIGRSLEQFGVPAGTTMANPIVDVVNSAGTVVAQNDNAVASSTLTAATTRAGAFSLSSAQDAATVITLPAGAYTVRLREATGLRGDALLEVYDVD